MKRNFLITILLCGLLSLNGFAQEQELDTLNEPAANETSVMQPDDEYDPLTPSKAAFYSAVLPGLGQAYNQSYWKIPIVYGGIGTGIYFYIRNDHEFQSYRKAYKRRLAGFEDDEYQGQISDDGLVRAQKLFRKNKEISIFVTILIYALNIIDANVEAHLRQFNVSDNLALKPDYEYDEFTGRSNYGISLNFKF